MQEVEFRNGPRLVPDHVADLMSGLETWTMTYEDALQRANKRLLVDRLNEAGAKVVRDHLQEGRSWRR